MTIDEIDAAIAAAMDELKDAGQPLSKNRIARKVPADRNTVLQRIDIVQTGHSVEVYVDTTVADRLAEAQQHRRQTVARLNALQDSLHGGNILTHDEELEQIQLERRLQNLDPAITHLENEAARVQARIDVESVQKVWELMMARKAEAYENLVHAVNQLEAALDVVLEVHSE